MSQDKDALQHQVETSYYRDEHLEKNITEIQRILENSLGSLLNTAERNSLRIWKTLHGQMETALDDYRNYINTCAGRKDYQECERCLRRLEKLLSISTAKSEEESKLTCCVCMDTQVNCVAVCGHLLCSTCTQSVEKCPVCRKEINAADIRTLYFC